MNSTADDMKDLIEAESELGLVFATNLFVGREPASPDNCVTLFDTPGFGPMMSLDGMNNYHYSSFQVQVRNRSYPVAYGLIYNIVAALHGRGNEEVGGTRYLSIACVSDPYLLAWDENGRVHLGANFNVQRRS